MKKNMKKRKNLSINSKKQDSSQNKTTAKLVLFTFGIGPILGIILFLAKIGFFTTP